MSSMESLHALGTHLIIEVWDAKNLDNEVVIEKMMLDSIKAAGATLLHFHLHKFEGGGGGITAVAVLSESHASFHSYPVGSPEIPEGRSFAALDFFTCGKAEPKNAISIIEKALEVKEMSITEMKRGLHQKDRTSHGL